MNENPLTRSAGIVLVLATALCVAIAIWLFPKALPTIALKQEMTRDLAIESAAAFADRHQLPVSDARVAVQFAQDGETQTFIELEAGGKPAVNTEVNQGDVHLFSWAVRYFRSGDPREVRVTVAPDGRIIGFRDILADADTRPALDSAGAFTVADSVRISWLGLDGEFWRPISMSTETVQPSGRLDRTFTWERTDRTLGAAPLRLDVVVRGNQVGGARRYARIPESFLRRYEERRADNDLYALIASLFVPVFVLLGFAALLGARKHGLVRWKPAFIAGGVIGGALTLAQLNGIPGSYFGYDTAVPPGTFLSQQWMFALLGGAGLAVVSAWLLATGEYLTRDAFPQHYDWYKSATYAGTRPLALRILGGYTLAAFGLAYVAVFYLLVEKGLGWWSPGSLLDDPNQIATPFPWLAALATSLQAGVLEEILFRAIPLALVARFAGNRPWRKYALAGAVVLTALVFGFAHANYPSFPAYARGVELFAESVLWALIYLRFGLLTTIIGHFTYDLTLFGLFAAAGDALPYRITLAIVVLIALLPALTVAYQWWRAGRLAVEAPADARFGAWAPPAGLERSFTDELPVPVRDTRVRVHGGLVAMGVLGVVVATVLSLWPGSGSRPIPYSASRDVAVATADSVLRTLGASPEGWTPLTAGTSQAWGQERLFLREQDSTDSVRERLGNTWLHAAQWDVRYVHVRGSVNERAESWAVQLMPDGTPHSWQHIISDSAAAPAMPRGDAEAAARSAVRAAFGGTKWAEPVFLSAKETVRPARVDVDFVFVDTTIHMPRQASARYTATVSGNQVTDVGHRVFLPEEWERATAARIATRSTIAGAIGVLLLVAGLVALLRYLKRPPVVSAIPWPSRGRMLSVLALVGVVMVLLGANGWPANMYGWDTASPFNRHQWTSVLGLLGNLLVPAVFWGLWLVADAARRRMGVPLRSSSAREAWIVGGALALGPVLQRAVSWWLSPTSWSTPSTTMNQLVPGIEGITTVVSGALTVVPLFVLAAGALLFIRSRMQRMVAVVVVALLMGVMGSAGSTVTTAEWLQHAFTEAVGFCLLAAVLWRYGNSSVEAWLAGGIILTLAPQVAAMVQAGVAVDRISHALGIVVGIAVAVWVIGQRRALVESA